MAQILAHKLMPKDDPSYVEIAARDSVLAHRIAEGIARTHFNDYELTTLGRRFRFEDLETLQDRQQRSFFESLGCYALRFCRLPWRKFAHQKAVDRAMAVAEEYFAQYFTKPSDVDPTIRVRIDPAHQRALLSILVNEVCVTYRSVLDGAIPVLPGDLVRLRQEELVKR